MKSRKHRKFALNTENWLDLDLFLEENERQILPEIQDLMKHTAIMEAESEHSSVESKRDELLFLIIRLFLSLCRTSRY